MHIASYPSPSHQSPKVLNSRCPDLASFAIRREDWKAPEALQPGENMEEIFDLDAETKSIAYEILNELEEMSLGQDQTQSGYCSQVY